MASIQQTPLVQYVIGLTLNRVKDTVRVWCIDTLQGNANVISLHDRSHRAIFMAYTVAMSARDRESAVQLLYL